ncbi:MAG: protein kinase [Gemmatimonadota bacterium]|nr:MAG: protein kinase [Gemmatimonadota bacterium]
MHRPVVDEVLETVQRELEGRFQINVLLRHGTRSVVYVADELPHKRMVALKVIPLQRGMTPDLARFQREASVAASLSHSHIARVLGFGKTRALLWYSMEYVKGHSVADLQRDSGPLDLDTCQKILEQAAIALDYMHRRGVTHGNLKPSNILVDREEWARVSDACIMNTFAEAGRRSRITSGSPEYMAPEQFRERTVGPSADQYALGVVAYECLSGNLPFVGDSPDEMERLHRAEAPIPLEQSRDDLPPHVREAVHQALSKMPGERFPTVLDFVAMLRKDWVAPGPAPFATDVAPSGQSHVFVIDGERSKFPIVRAALVALVTLLIVLGATWLKPWQAILGSRDAGPPSPSSVARPSSDQSTPTQQAEPRPTQRRPEPTTPPAASRSESRPPVRAPAAPVEPGRLLVNSTPWGQIYVDGELVGNTPMSLTLSAGPHTLRVVQDGFEPFEREIQLAPGQQLRMTDINLKARQP